MRRARLTPRAQRPRRPRRQMGAVTFFSTQAFLWFALSLVMSTIMMGVFMHFGVFGRSPQLSLLAAYVFAAALMGYLSARGIMRGVVIPVVEVSRGVRQVAQGDYDVRIEVDTPAREVAGLAEDFNTMTRQLASTEMLRNDFVSSVSHEFKTPVAAIEGYATLLQSAELTDQQRMLYAERLIANTKRLSSLTGNILLLSRVESGAVSPRRESFSLDEQIRQTILSLEPAWTKKGLDLDVDLDEVTYVGMPDLLDHVWQNLVDNAVKFSEPGGRVCVRLRADAGEKDGRTVRVWVSDTGIGMDEEAASHVFDKFYQADRSHATEGNGLGLALAQRVVALHGGTIAVESAVGAGTTFTVELPVKG